MPGIQQALRSLGCSQHSVTPLSVSSAASGCHGFSWLAAGLTSLFLAHISSGTSYTVLPAKSFNLSPSTSDPVLPYSVFCRAHQTMLKLLNFEFRAWWAPASCPHFSLCSYCAFSWTLTSAGATVPSLSSACPSVFLLHRYKLCPPFSPLGRYFSPASSGPNPSHPWKPSATCTLGLFWSIMLPPSFFSDPQCPLSVFFFFFKSLTLVTCYYRYQFICPAT